MKWSISIVVNCVVLTKFATRHYVGTVIAQNKDEAYGKAWQIGQIIYPGKDGFTNHHVMVDSVDNVSEIETAKPARW